MATANRVLIFVYGTLRQGFGNYERYLQNKKDVKLICNDSIMAKMYTTHWGFPHICLSNFEGDKVFGEVYEVPMTLVTKGLDYLEGYDPKRADNLYNRKTVKTITGHEVFVYEAGSFIMKRPCAYLPGGDWKKALEEYEIMPEKFPMELQNENN
jgi:gamma-glutamylcyclotransferase (GGCT)/AIG2-like uncharacterized protein YtfP